MTVGRLWRTAAPSTGDAVNAHELLLARPDRCGQTLAQGVEWIETARLDCTRLWLVDHLVREESAPGRARAGGQRPWRERRFAFDVARAELEVAAACRPMAAMQAQWAGALLSGAHDMGEDAGEALEQARAAAEEAAAARRHDAGSNGASRAGVLRAPRGVIDAEATQKCRYRGMCCTGCGERFACGESMRGGGVGFVHCRRRCSEAAQRALRGEAARASECAGHAWPPMVSDATADEARACSVWAKLEREYAFSDGRSAPEAGGLLLPRHDRSTFMDFVRWLASGDAVRARSLDQVRIAVRVFAAETRLTDWSADAEIAALMEQLMEQAAVVSDDE